MKSAELFERSKRVSPGGVHSPVRGFRGVGGTPVFVREAQGAHFTDVEGKRYVDFCQSWGPLLFGHQDPEVRAAVDQALSRGWSYGAAEPYSLELAELITGAIPWVKKVRFVNSGTEAVMSALRVARAATRREKILKFDGCYHGHVDSMLVRAGSGLAEMASSDSAGVSDKVASDTLVCKLDDDEGLAAMFAEHGREIAAVILEALPANNGLLPQRREFLQKIVDLAQSHRALVIFDEVITGFRVRFGGMAEALGVRPDLVTYGKVIGGGFPVGAYGGSADLLDLVAPAGPVYQAGTLSANPVAMAAGLAMLKKLKREQPYAQLEAATARFAGELARLASEAGVPGAVQTQSSMFWGVFGEIGTRDGVVRAIEQIPATQKAWFGKFFHGMLARGVYLAPSGFEVGFLSTAHTDEILGQTLEAARAVLKEGVC